MAPYLYQQENRLVDFDESLLVEEAKRGDHSSFEKLYRRNVGKIYAVCFRISADKNRAEELTQTVFIKAWENLNSFKGESMFSTWIYRIAINTSLISLRSKKRRMERFRSLTGLFNLTKKNEQPHISIDLEKAISELPEKARAVFFLHDVEGFKHSEISEMMSITEGTTKAQLHRARKLLREALEK